MISRLVVGATVVPYINGRLFAEVAGLRYTSETPRTAKRGIDTLLVVEFIPTGYMVTGSLVVYRRRKAGSVEAAGLVATYPDLPREKYFTLTLLDRGTDTVLFQAERCSVVSQSWQIGREHLRGQISFMGQLGSNETQPDG